MAAHLDEGDAALFSWYHDSDANPPRDCVAVLCPPFGHEYSSSHRSIRHLADALARRGVPAVRFDYHGTGDSPGTDTDPDRLRRWQSDVAAAIARAREWSGRSAVCLIGLRFGATVAALAAATCDVDLLVMWNAVVKGRQYVRELQAVAMAAERPARPVDGELEAAGFLMTAETLESIKAVDLAKADLRVGQRALVVVRDDLSPDPGLVRRLGELGIAHDQVAAAGWSGMVAEPHYTEVPQAALGTIADWVAQQATPCPAAPPRIGTPAGAARFRWNGPGGGEGIVEEEACRFGEGGRLFGILSRPVGATGAPVVVMPNSGAVHHVGPNRLYVLLARHFALMGFPCLRYDLLGLGDSVREEGPENNSYPDWAVADTRAAMEHLERRLGHSSFIVMGLCSGAHTAFHSGLGLDQHDLPEVVLINPLAYHWEEGMSLEVTRQFSAVQHYRRSARDPRRWLKALRGDVDFASASRAAVAYARWTLRSNFDALRETLQPGKAPRLSRDLRALFAMHRKLTLVISEGDPGADLLIAGAKHTATKAMRSGDIRMSFIDGADHTFSQLEPRQRLIRHLAEHLAASARAVGMQRDDRA